MSPQQRAALNRFAQRHGRGWKAHLYNLWYTGRDAGEPDGPLLRQIRNGHFEELEAFRAGSR